LPTMWDPSMRQFEDSFALESRNERKLPSVAETQSTDNL
jgi:hypothetical protein